MTKQKEPPRPHGDPLADPLEADRLNTGDASDRNVDSGKRDARNLDRGTGDEENAAQRQSDATNDVTGLVGVEEPTLGTTSDANGIGAGDDTEGARRRKQYNEGADLVSKID